MCFRCARGVRVHQRGARPGPGDRHRLCRGDGNGLECCLPHHSLQRWRLWRERRHPWSLCQHHPHLRVSETAGAQHWRTFPVVQRNRSALLSVSSASVNLIIIITYYYYYWSLLYSAILRSRADSLRSHVIRHEWLAFYSAFFLISTEVVYLQRWHGWCHKKLLPSRRVLCTPYNHAPCHFMQSHIHKVYACLAVTCHLRFWQND